MTGKFETLDSNFSNETRFCEVACVLCYFRKVTSFRTLINTCPKEKTFRYSMSHKSHHTGFYDRKIRDLSSNFSNETRFLRGCLRPLLF